MQSELAQRGTRTRPLDELLVEIAAIRNGAVARDIDEHTDGISALGYAVRDSHGDIYAVSVPVPSSRFQVIETSLRIRPSIDGMCSGLVTCFLMPMTRVVLNKLASPSKATHKNLCFQFII
jgi:hypothetical protein